MGGWRKWQLGINSRGCQVTKSWERLKVLRADDLEKVIIPQSLLAGDKVGEGQWRAEVTGRHWALYSAGASCGLEKGAAEEPWRWNPPTSLSPEVIETGD